ncbi:ImmA/IrrE family metallo-endopeptidase [Paenibacillus sp. YN15]|uniref:ImmA/IrrE family metallo-endopeptidase n=1 Tax=Paenibacillus sp. YN15 TaxID=1742774 RepID=UPI000DCAEB22|nr:ImmA/IrrE family metallo-endopeptidase [Paenibacillus sp. YN15]RAU92481.1 terminase [Paenibacillus sp. YN15]
MPLDLYHPTQLESWISEKYQQDGIFSPHEMNLDRIAALFGIDVMYYMGPSFADWKDGQYSVIFLNKLLTVDKQREAFFHELCHPLRHVGHQKLLPPGLAQLQEVQAETFQLYASMPFYMLVEYEECLRSGNGLYTLATEFALPESLVKRRLKQIMSRIRRGEENQRINDTLPAIPEPRIISHSPDTLKMLNKLLWLSAQRGRKVNLNGRRV